MIDHAKEARQCMHDPQRPGQMPLTQASVMLSIAHSLIAITDLMAKEAATPKPSIFEQTFGKP